MKQILVTVLLGASWATAPGQQNNLVADGATLQLVSDQFTFTEGPAAAPNGDVYFTDQPNDRIYLWDAQTNQVEVFMEPAGRANGLWLDPEGRLLAAADEKFELRRFGPNKEVEVLTDSFDGKKLNGPNDIWVHPDGTIYFTDPYYQRPWWQRTEMEQEAQQVYRIRPGQPEVLLSAGGLVQPNGIIGTTDGKYLYVADIGDSKTYRYTIGADGSLSEQTQLIGMGSDGMTLDEHGNLYLTGRGVTVFSPSGQQLAHIDVPENWTANVTFGGTDGKTLFITAMDSVYTLRMNLRGMWTKP